MNAGSYSGEIRSKSRQRLSRSSSDGRAIGYHHLARTGGAALVRRMYETGTAHPWVLKALEATNPREETIKFLDRLSQDSSVLFHSHNAFGLHKLVDWNVSYFTVLREPVAHTISMFYWTAGLELRDLELTAITDRLAAFVDSFEHLNHQAFELAICAQDRPDNYELLSTGNLVGTGDDLLRPAIEHLSSMFLFVGHTDQPTDTYAFLERTFGFSDLASAAEGFENRSLAPLKHGRGRMDNIPASVLAAIREKTKVDQLLFDNHGFARQDHQRTALPRRSPQRSRKYNCRIDQPWSFFVEGLIELGAEIGRGIDIEGTGCRRWTLRALLPLAEPGDEDFVCSFRFSAPMVHGEVCPTRVFVQVGSTEAQTSQLTSRGTTQSVECVALGSDLVEGHLEILMTAEQSLQPEIGEISNINPLPYMLQSILVRKMALLRTNEALVISPEGSGRTALISGFAPPQIEGFAWSIGKKARMLLRVSDGAILELAANASPNRGSIAALELEVAPLLVEGKITGQTLVVEVNGRKANLRLREAHWVIFLIEIGELNNGILKIDFEFPDAITLADAIGHPDTINLHSVMFRKVRLSPIGDLTAEAWEGSTRVAPTRSLKGDPTNSWQAENPRQTSESDLHIE